MIQRTEKGDKHHPPALVKAPPHIVKPGIVELDKDRFEALLQKAGDLPDAIPEQRPLARSPLFPHFDAAPAGEGPAVPQGEAAASTPSPLADAFESPSQPAHAADAAGAKPGSASKESQSQSEDEDPAAAVAAEPGMQATPGSLDPRVLKVLRKRKLQMEKMHEDAAKATAQDQAATRPAQPLSPSGTVASGKATLAPRVDRTGAVGKADAASLTARAPTPSFGSASAPPSTSTSASASASAQAVMPEDESLLATPEHEERTRQHQHHESERGEVAAAEAGAAQAVQQQMLALRNTPESLPVHLLESI